MEIVHIDNLLWMPIRTKPKKEKKLAEYCEANNIIYYLPLTKSVKRYGRKTVEFYPPMFQGYIFCQLDHDLYKLLVRSHGVFFKVNIDEVLEVQLIKDLKSIQNIEKVSTKKEVTIKPELAEGEQVVITDGPMQGTTGVITRRAGDIIVTVNVDILGQSVSVKMDIGEIELEK
jgi:transcriptional antiterminator RfaH